MNHVAAHVEIPRIRARREPQGRAAEIVDYLRQHDANHSEVSRVFGVTRENVRQLALKYLSETGAARAAGSGRLREQKLASRIKKTLRNRRGHQLLTVFEINRWLRQIGCFYCPTCRRALSFDDRSKSGVSGGNRCNACNSANGRKVWAGLGTEERKRRARQMNQQQKIRKIRDAGYAMVRRFLDAQGAAQ